MIHITLLEVLGYAVPLYCTILYFCNLYERSVQQKDRYLIKILLIAGKKAITKKWGKPDPPTQDQWLDIIEGIYVTSPTGNTVPREMGKMDCLHRTATNITERTVD